MLSRFLKWWFAELAALLGSGPGGQARDTGEYLRLRLDNRQVQVGRLRHGRCRPVAELAVDENGRMAGLPQAIAAIDPVRTRCRVILPADTVLARELELPLAAEENLREVLRFEMDRQTPFRADEVYYDYRILKRDAAAQKLWVYLQVARRSLVDNLIAHLGHWDLRSVHSQAGTVAGGELILDFEPGVFQERSSTGFNLLLAGIVVLLAAVTVVLPMREQQQLHGRLETQLNAARLAAAQAVKVRNLLDERLAAGRILREAKRARPAMVVLLEALSRALPDDTYLLRLEVRDGELSLQGSSKSASALIGILEQNPYLSNARFASPVTREGKDGRERFHISVKLLPHQPRDSAGWADPKAAKRS